MLTSEDRLNLDCMIAAYMVLIERRTRAGNINRITYRHMVEASHMVSAATAMKALYEAAGFPHTAATEKSQQWFNSFNGKAWPAMTPLVRREKLWAWIQDEDPAQAW